MGPRAGLDRCEKSRPPPGFDPRTVQPVASRYTPYATRPTERTEIQTKFKIPKRKPNIVPIRIGAVCVAPRGNVAVSFQAG